jgi:hypothetical protein
LLEVLNPQCPNWHQLIFQTPQLQSHPYNNLDSKLTDEKEKKKNLKDKNSLGTREIVHTPKCSFQ